MLLGFLTFVISHKFCSKYTNVRFFITLLQRDVLEENHYKTMYKQDKSSVPAVTKSYQVLASVHTGKVKLNESVCSMKKLDFCVCC